MSASNTGIHISPVIITHSAPGIILANLHTTLCWYQASNQPDVSVSAGTCNKTNLNTLCKYAQHEIKYLYLVSQKYAHVPMNLSGTSKRGVGLFLRVLIFCPPHTQFSVDIIMYACSDSAMPYVKCNNSKWCIGIGQAPAVH